MEPCPSYEPWHDKQTGKTFLRTRREVPALLLLLHRRDARPVLPPRADLVPVPAQFYFNGHNWLAPKLDREGISYEMKDNAFVAIDDWERPRIYPTG